MSSFTILWSLARPHKGALAAGLVLALAGSAAGLAMPMVTKWVLESLGEPGALAGPVLALLGLFVVGAVLSLVQWVLLGTVGERIVLQARESMVRRYLRATVPAVTRWPDGELVTRVTSDTVLLREAASSSVIGLFNGVVMLVGSLVLMAVLDLVLLATTVGAVVVVLVLFGLLMPGIAREHELAQERVGRLGGVLQGALRAVRTVKASRAETRQAERVMVEATAAAEHGIRALRREAIAWVVAWSGIQLAIVAILGVGAWRVSEGYLEVSALIAFLLYAFQLMEPITELSQNVTTLQAGVAAARRIRDVEELAVETDPPVVRDDHDARDARDARDAPARRPGDAVLELRDVTAGYGDEVAVREVSLAIPRRGHIAIVGPSGAGKTTLLSLIMRFLEPTSGTLLIDGIPYAGQTYSAVRARLAYVEQETPVVPGTIRDNLLFTHPDATVDDVRQVLAEVQLDDKITALPDGLDTDLMTTALSGGQRQRLALARAILRAPDVLLLDEATAQVDGLTERAVQECIRRRAAEGAVVTVAHRLSTVIDADEIVVLDGGRIRGRGTHEALLSSDKLYRELVTALRIADDTHPPATPVPDVGR